MKVLKTSPGLFFGMALVVFLASFPSAVFGQTYPNKPITVYCAYAAGATTDVTARALAQGAEKLLGVPVVVENKPGGTSTVATALVASKKPDGYTLCVTSAGALTARPLLMKVAYNHNKDFTLIMQYSNYIGGLCVLSDSPIKTVDDFVAYAKAHPGLSYGSPGMFSGQSLSVELLGMCRGLKFKHVPTKGGAEANTLLMGKQTDFVAGAGQHIMYVKQGVFRMLAILMAEKRSDQFPDIPTVRELGCADYPSHGFIVIGPRGLPEPVTSKLREVFKKVVYGPEFQKVLTNFDLPFDYRDKPQLEKDIPAEYETIKNLLNRLGIKGEKG